MLTAFLPKDLRLERQRGVVSIVLIRERRTEVFLAQTNTQILLGSEPIGVEKQQLARV
jgi:hypothetical protein